ncbi:MAG: zinc ribbon domain-containing protein [Deltaproteobacteria bacterium]|jgi:putative FmdB family regulatory protein|nr:zinc ribbon domain-containing protein [Deltaproteobacteria bacterium]
MPIYKYCCDECGCNFELLTTRSEEQPATCPKCGTKDVKGQMSVSCIGGSGFSNCGGGGSGGFS